MSGWNHVEKETCLLKTKRELGLFSTVMMGLSGAIGFEIFILLNYAYFHLVGYGLIWALLLAGLINILIMLSYCELGAAMPMVGGEYTYIKNAYGGFVAFISGCFRWLASEFGAALAAVSFTQQLAHFFSIVAPATEIFILEHAPLIIIIVVLIFMMSDIKGVKQLGSVIVIVFLALFTVLIIGGLLHGTNPPGILSTPPLESLPSALAAVVYVFPMFFGMRALVAGAVHVKNPGKNIPRGILLSALLIIPLYVGLAYIGVSVVSPEEAPSTLFLNLAAERVMGWMGGVLFAFAGMVASLSALGTSLSVQSSISRGMSRDKYLPKILLSVHRRFGTPYVAVVTGSVFVMLLGSIGAVEFLGYGASIGSLIVFAFVNLSLLKLRKEKPHMERPFKTPFYPFTPIAGFLMSVVLLVFPMFLGDENALNALTSGVGLTALVVMTYYLRMVGHHRLQIAVGGACFGIGILLTLLTCLAATGIISSIFPFIPNPIAILIGLISMIAGFLNITERIT